MPGMNLKFLNNPSQRIATGKSLPLKQLEAIVAYGTAEQRAKVVAKVLPQTYTLSLHKSTHHILATILAHCDNLVRAQMLYHLRRKLNDMARSPVGNLLLQQLLEYLPNMQRKEIAEAFVLNVEEEELETVCKHPFGNHVAQKLLEYPASADVIVEKLQPMIQRLVTHPHGQRVVSRLVENVEGGAAAVCKALFPAGGASDDELSSLEDMLQGVEESLVITALLKHPSVDTAVKDSIIACLLEHADDFTALDGGASKKKKPVDGGRPSSSTVSYAEPDFISGASSTPVRAPTARTRNGDADEDLSAANNEEGSKYRHSFAYASAIEFGDDTQRKELYAALKPRLAQFASTKGQTVILLALFKFAETAVPTVQADVMTALFATSGAAASEPVVAATPTPAKKGKKAAAVVVDTDSEDAATVALHPVKSVVLRSVIEVSPDCLSKARINQLVAAAGTLAVSAVGGPVLQRLVESSSNEVRQAVFNAIKKDVPNLALDGCGSFLLQQLLEHCEGGVKDKVVDAVVECLCEDPCKSLATAQGSRTMQKLIAYASDDVVRKVVDAILEGEEDEGSDAEDEEAEEGAENEEGAEEKPQLSWKEQRLINQKKHYKIRDGRLLSYAVHNHACFAVQALLRECKSRLLQDHRKRLVNSLKPYVFDLAVSPWAGRLVLDSMLTSGSAELKTAIKNVVFMKAESWLSDVPAHAKGQAGIDPTLRRTLRRGRENEGNDGNQKKARSESKSEEAPAAAKKPAKKVFRSLKK